MIAFQKILFCRIVMLGGGIALLLSACGTSSTSTLDSSNNFFIKAGQPGWVIYEDKDYRFFISIPSNWKMNRGIGYVGQKANPHAYPNLSVQWGAPNSTQWYQVQVFPVYTPRDTQTQCTLLSQATDNFHALPTITMEHRRIILTGFAEYIIYQTIGNNAYNLAISTPSSYPSDSDPLLETIDSSFSLLHYEQIRCS